MILVTGSAGFVGRALLNSFGDDAIGIRRFEGKDNELTCDLSNAEEVSRTAHMLEKHQISCLIHTAAVTPWTGEPDFLRDLEMARSVVWLCESLNIPRLIFISGWNVYDMTSDAPFPESSPINPDSEYGKSKSDVEAYLTKNTDRTQVINLRVASLYGPGQTSSGLIPNLVSLALRGSTINLDSLDTKRDYLYIDDFVQVIHSLVRNKDNSIPRYLNIGSGSSTAVIEVARTIQNIFKKLYATTIVIEVSKKLKNPLPADNKLDIREARRNNLLQDQTSLEDGLTQYIKWRKNESIL